MDYITAPQVAREHGVSLRTVHRLIKSGDLPHEQKISGGTGPYLLDPEVVERVFAARAEARVPAA